MLLIFWMQKRAQQWLAYVPDQSLLIAGLRCFKLFRQLSQILNLEFYRVEFYSNDFYDHLLPNYCVVEMQEEI